MIDATVIKLTSAAPSAIAVVELSGKYAASLLQEFWTAANQDLPFQVDDIRYGVWKSRNIGNVDRSDEEETGLSIGEDVVVCQIEESKFEIHCHGGAIAAGRIIRDLESRCTSTLSHTNASPLFEAESVTVDELVTSQDGFEKICTRWESHALEDLPSMTTLQTTKILLWQADGALRNALASIRTMVRERRNGEACKLCRNIIESARFGLRLKNGWTIAIAGIPNAGKSSLLNRVLGFSRALVDDLPGTTRDRIEERIAIDGWHFKLIDTAGIRESACEIEAEGVRRSQNTLHEADLIWLLIDTERYVDDRFSLFEAEVERQIIRDFAAKVLIVKTKCDLATRCDLSVPSTTLPTVTTSSLTGQGIEDLLKITVTLFVSEDSASHKAVCFRDEHVKQFQSILEELESRELNAR